MTSVLDIRYLISIFLCLFGLTPFILRNNQIKFVKLAIIVIVVIQLSFDFVSTYTGYYGFIKFSLRSILRDISSISNSIKIMITTCMHKVLIINTIVTRENHIRIVKGLSSIDRKFERNLNIEIDDNSFDRNYALTIIIVIVVNVSLEVYGLLTFLRDVQTLVYIFYLCHFVEIFVQFLSIIQIRNYVKLLTARVEKLIELLNGDEGKRLNQIHVREIHNNLWSLKMLINKTFGFSILLQVGYNFIVIAVQLYIAFVTWRLYFTFYFLHALISGFVYSYAIVPQVAQLYFMILTFDDADAKFEVLGRVIIKTANFKETNYLMLKALHYQNEKFSAYKFFDVNFTLFYNVRYNEVNN